MRSQVQAAKEYKPETIYERLRRLEIQLDQHQQENQFYGVFFDLYKELHAIVIGVSQNLILQSYFEPESIPARDPFIYDAIRQLNAALTHAKAAEVQAEANWKTYWNISPTADVPTSWI
ncbi:hypothetical protein CBS63078_10941 [Aspergillus niger]|nr:hypothetical protein CBS12448_10289 [Aspergillus niger]KAI2874419.1 hypothetical protein CBS11852_10670 [Aspergillus niger]KAI2886536.1 hypothetical protein CBS63078_10941 [Aspergillus niger]KAI2936717.1 hypothetical protein CBS147322_11057 [Aspergillus niger]KAI2937254.1 hypothetical protein CBS147321_7969 [Aspergillus niger]